MSLLWILGLYEYDPDGKKAGALENAIGIKVIRHGKFCSSLELLLSGKDIFFECTRKFT